MVYYTTEEDVGDAIREFMLPANEGALHTGLYQFKNALFKTKSIDAGFAMNLNEDELRILVDNFARVYGGDPDLASLLEIKELQDLLTSISQIPDRDRRQEIIANSFPVNRMTRAEVHFANDICQFWCSHCRTLFFEESVVTDRRFNVYRCPNCNRALQITPVWVLKEEGDRSRTTPLPVWINGVDHDGLWKAWRNHSAPACPKCASGRINIYYSRSPERLMESSVVECSSCHHQFRLFSRNYSLTGATENLTQPFVVSTYNRSMLYLNAVNVAKLVEGPTFNTSLVEEFLYSPEARIKEIVLGYLYGANVTETIKARRYGRDLKTGALYLRIKSTYYAEALSFLREVYRNHPNYGTKYQSIDSSNEDLHKLVLHSIAHAIKSMLPSTSGVALDTFAYIYDLTNDSVLVYEQAPGGLGACAELSKLEESKKEPIALEFFTRLRDNVITCTCDDRCKYCIAMKGCQEWNEALSRFALGPLLRIDAHEVSWGF